MTILKKIIFSMIYFPVLIVLILSCRLLKKQFFKFQPTMSGAIGHFIQSNEVLFQELRLKSSSLGRAKLVLYDTGKPANAEIRRLIERSVKDLGGFYLPYWLEIRYLVHLLIHYKQVSFILDLRFFIPVSGGHDRNDVLHGSDPALKLTKCEIARAKQIAQEFLALPKKSKWVVIHVRRGSTTVWRNSAPENYAQTVEYLAEFGIYSIQIGTDFGSRIPTNSPFLISALSKTGAWQDLHCYFGQECLFFLGSGSGPEAFAFLGRRPIARVNATYLHYLEPNVLSLFIPKLHFARGSNHPLSLREIYAKTLDSVAAPESRRLYLKENTPEQIRAVAQEMLVSLGIVPFDSFYSSQDQELQRQFRAVLRPGPEVSKVIRCRIGRDFLRSFPGFVSS